LVIDDEPTVRDLLTRFLSKEGFSACSAPDGQRGLDMARSKRPDAIILDVMMPRLDGWAVLSALKADPLLAPIPVILLTIVDDKSLGYTLGVAEYLTKPIRREKLVEALGKHLVHCPPGAVLVVEDDTSVRRLVRQALRQDHRQVVEAENGRVALERLATLTPIAIVLDLIMPQMDGFEFLEALRANPSWREIPVIILTSKDLSTEERERLSGRAASILQKNRYRLDDVLPELRKLVAECVARRPAPRATKGLAVAQASH
jgi:CheY-like chemotaxis protein